MRRARPLPGDVRCVAGGHQRHAAAVVRGGLPQRAAVRGGGGGGHHRLHRGRRGHVAGPGQPAAGLLEDPVPDRLRSAELLLCHRQAGHHLGDARRRRHLEQPCAFPGRGRREPYQPGMPAGSCGCLSGQPCRLGLLDIACVSASICYAVATGPAGYFYWPISVPGYGRAAECHLDDQGRRNKLGPAAHPAGRGVREGDCGNLLYHYPLEWISCLGSGLCRAGGGYFGGCGNCGYRVRRHRVGPSRRALDDAHVRPAPRPVQQGPGGHASVSARRGVLARRRRLPHERSLLRRLRSSPATA